MLERLNGMEESDLERVELALQRANAELPWNRLRGQRLLKRAFDIVVSALMILFGWPVFAVIALLVRATSKGPVLFSQTRLGLGAKPFTIYKFRTMTTGDHELMEVMATDPRLTPIGAFLRSSKLDELPQLFHVLFGQMSLVGPRPDVPQNFHRHSEQQLMRFAMPQGCTTWGVIRGGHALDWNARQDINAEYVWKWNIWLDLKIVLQTPAVILGQKGTLPESTEN